MSAMTWPVVDGSGKMAPSRGLLRSPAEVSHHAVGAQSCPCDSRRPVLKEVGPGALTCAPGLSNSPRSTGSIDEVTVQTMSWAADFAAGVVSINPSRSHLLGEGLRDPRCGCTRDSLESLTAAIASRWLSA